MTSRHASDFGPFDGKVWLNCAHQGPLPRAAVKAADHSNEVSVDGRLQVSTRG